MSFLLPFAKPLNIDYDDEQDFEDGISEESAFLTDDDVDDNFKRPSTVTMNLPSSSTSVMMSVPAISSNTMLNTQTTSTGSHERKRKRRHPEVEDVSCGAQFLQGRRSNEENENELFLKSILPMMNTLEPLDAMELRHEVQGLLISYVKRARCMSPGMFMASSTGIAKIEPLG